MWISMGTIECVCVRGKTRKGKYRKGGGGGGGGEKE